MHQADSSMMLRWHFQRTQGYPCSRKCSLAHLASPPYSSCWAPDLLNRQLHQTAPTGASPAVLPKEDGAAQLHLQHARLHPLLIAGSG